MNALILSPAQFRAIVDWVEVDPGILPAHIELATDAEGNVIVGQGEDIVMYDRAGIPASGQRRRQALRELLRP